MEKSELIDREARRLAQALLEIQLAKRDLPLPRGVSLDFHIDALLATDARIRATATRHVELKAKTYQESLRHLGLDESDIELVTDLDTELDDGTPGEIIEGLI